MPACRRSSSGCSSSSCPAFAAPWKPEAGDGVPRYRVGVAALRNYDYHAVVPEAAGLMQLCFELEQLLDPYLGIRPA